MFNSFFGDVLMRWFSQWQPTQTMLDGNLPSRHRAQVDGMTGITEQGASSCG